MSKSTSFKKTSAVQIMLPVLVFYMLGFCQMSNHFVWADGNVTMTLSNRGDITIRGDNLDNQIGIFYDIDENDQEVVLIQGENGTTITLIQPGDSPVTQTEFSIPREQIDMIRNLSLDLRGGNNDAIFTFLPSLIFGNVRIDMGRGQNYIVMIAQDSTEILGSINVRGSRTAEDSFFMFLGPFDFFGDDPFLDDDDLPINPNSSRIRARQVAVDVGGNGSIVYLGAIEISRNLTATMRGNNSELFLEEVFVDGRANLRIRGSSGAGITVFFADFVGRSSIQTGGNNGFIFLDDVYFIADLNLRMGNDGNILELFDCEFFSSRRSRFQAGRGENKLFYNLGTFFETLPDIRGFEIFEIEDGDDDDGDLPF